MNKKSIGLVLSGGGARGIAHIGVLRVFEREGIPIDFLAGTSMGGIMAAGFAAGMTSFDLEKLATSTTQNNGMLRLIDPGMPRGGVLRGQRVLNYFKGIFGEKEFSDLEIPLALIAVDLNSHREVVLEDGPLAEAIRATISIPGVFMPFEMNGMRLVDGGVLNNLPVDVAMKMGASHVIATDIGISSEARFGKWIEKRRWIPKSITYTLNTFEETMYCLRTVEQARTLRECPPSLLICPVLPEDVNSLIGYGRVEELIEAGEKAAMNEIDQLRKFV